MGRRVSREAVGWALSFACAVACAGPSLATPASGPATAPSATAAKFPDGRAEVELKLGQGAGVLVTADVRIDGKDAGLFVIDTGADRTVLDVNVAARLGLVPVGTRPGGRNQYVGARSFAVGGVRVEDDLVVLADLSALDRALLGECGGLLGGNVFGRVPYRLDAQARTLTLYDPRGFRPPAGRAWELNIGGREIPATRPTWWPAGYDDRVAGFPLVAGSIDGVACRFLLDTAMTMPLSVHPRLTGQHPRWVDHEAGRTQNPEGMNRVGAAYPASVGSIELFGRKLGDLRGSLAYVDEPGFRQSPGVPKLDAAVGLPLLEHFRLTMDYAGGRVWAEWRPAPTVAQRIAAGALRPDERDLSGQTPLMSEAARGELAACEALLAAGADPAAEDPYGETVLHYAARGAEAKVIRLLLSRAAARAQVNARTTWKLTPLMLAAMAHDPAAAEALLGAGAELAAVDRDGQTALHIAAEQGTTRVLDLLIARKADLTARTTQGVTPLLMAAFGGSVDAFERLRQVGGRASTTRQGMTAMHLAADRGHVDMVRHLLGPAKGVPGIGSAASAAPNGATPLSLAVAKGHEEVVAILIDAGCDPAAVIESGLDLTPMHVAAMRGHASTIRLLLDRGAKPDPRARGGATPLILAAERGQDAAVAALLAGGANVVAADETGRTPLHAAATGPASGELVRRLVRAGAAVDAVAGARGARPLHVACAYGNPEVVAALLEAGADPLAKDGAGDPPAAVARRAGHAAVAALVEAHVGRTTRTKEHRP